MLIIYMTEPQLRRQGGPGGAHAPQKFAVPSPPHVPPHPPPQI